MGRGGEGMKNWKPKADTSFPEGAEFRAFCTKYGLPWGAQDPAAVAAYQRSKQWDATARKLLEQGWTTSAPDLEPRQPELPLGKPVHLSKWQVMLPLPISTVRSASSSSGTATSSTTCSTSSWMPSSTRTRRTPSRTTLAGSKSRRRQSRQEKLDRAKARKRQSTFHVKQPK